MRPLAVLALLAVAPVAVAQEKFLVPGDNLIIEGVPKIPQSVAERVARVLERVKFAGSRVMPTTSAA